MLEAGERVGGRVSSVNVGEQQPPLPEFLPIIFGHSRNPLAALAEAVNAPRGVVPLVC